MSDDELKSNGNAPPTGDAAGEDEGVDLARRMLLKVGALSAPAIVASFSISRPVAAATCTPNLCRPGDSCNPDVCGPKKCNPWYALPQRRQSSGGCGPANFKPRGCSPSASSDGCSPSAKPTVCSPSKRK